MKGSVEGSCRGWCDGAVLSDLSRTKSGMPRDSVIAKTFRQRLSSDGM